MTTERRSCVVSPYADGSHAPAVVVAESDERRNSTAVQPSGSGGGCRAVAQVPLVVAWARRDSGAGSFGSRPRVISGPAEVVSRRPGVSPGDRCPHLPAAAPAGDLKQVAKCRDPLRGMNSLTGSADLASAFALAPVSPMVGLAAFAVAGVIALGLALHRPRRAGLWSPLASSAAVMLATFGLVLWALP